MAWPDTPVFQQLQHETLGLVVGDHELREPQDPATTMMPAVDPGVPQRIEYAGHVDWFASPAPLERIDGWCEDRPLGHLSDGDGVE